MSNPRFTPREAVYGRLKARNLSFKDIRVGTKVLLTWIESWGENQEPCSLIRFGYEQ